jgi:hypothetical protein
MKNYESMVDALNDLKERGYWADFGTDTVCLYCGELDIRLNPEEFHVDEVYHFEGNSGADNTELYAITSSTGVKGILVDTSGVYAKKLNFGMADKVQPTIRGLAHSVHHVY